MPPSVLAIVKLLHQGAMIVLLAIMCGGVYFLGRHCAGRCVCCGNDNGVRITDMCHLDWNLVDGGVNVSC